MAAPNTSCFVGFPREDRNRELRGLRQTDPMRLIAIYQQATGTIVGWQMPKGVSFTSMIDAILDHEQATGKIRPC